MEGISPPPLRGGKIREVSPTALIRKVNEKGKEVLPAALIRKGFTPPP